MRLSLMLLLVVFLSAPALAQEECNGGNPDNDGDGWCRSEDCNDFNASIHPGAVENCEDGRDNNCNELVDGDDPQCQTCPDGDGDGFPASTCGGTDCDDTNGAVWSTPGATGCLAFTDQQTMTWCAPGSPGTSAALFYDLLRSSTPVDFDAAASCLEVDDTDTSAVDSQVPQLGEVLFYLPRAQNACGVGSLGHRSSGVARVGRSCP